MTTPSGTPSELYNYLRSHGGTPIARKGQYASGPDDVVEWNFGRLKATHPGGMKLRREYASASKKASSHIKVFRKGDTPIGADDPINLVKLWAHPQVVERFGKPFIGYGQTTGSCVGCGGGNNMTTIALLDVLLKGEPEKLYLPFWGVMYGRSRYYMGDRNRGEGSTEGTWAEAIPDGCLDSATPGLPTFTDQGGDLYMGTNNELAWSDGDSRPLTDFLEASRQHPIKEAFKIRDADEAWDALAELKVIGHGSMYGYTITGMADDGIAIGRRGPRWSHKEVILGRRLINGKRYFLNVNTWKYEGHKFVWIPDTDVTWIAQDEMYAYRGLDGIPDDVERLINWTNLPV